MLWDQFIATSKIKIMRKSQKQKRVIAMNIILYQSFYLFLPKERTFKFKPQIQTVNGNKSTSSQSLKLDTVTYKTYFCLLCYSKVEPWLAEL